MFNIQKKSILALLFYILVAVHQLFCSSILPVQNYNYTTGQIADYSRPIDFTYLELVFVIDATMGMQDYIKATSKVMAQVTSRVMERGIIGIKISVVCYRDYALNHSSMKYVTKQFMPLTTDISKVIHCINTQINAATVGSEDYPNAAFDGLYAGITETNWQQTSDNRIIIWIANASPHPTGSPKNVNYSIPQLLTAANKPQIRISAIKINSWLEEDNEAHLKQVEQLVMNVNEEKRGFAKIIQFSDDDMITNYIQKTVSSLKAEVERLEKMFRTLDNSTSNKYVNNSPEIMLVIDTNNEMGAYIGNVKKLIKRLILRVRSTTEANIRIGAIGYRDYVTNQSDMKYITKMYAPLRKGITRINKIIDEDIIVTDRGSEDFPEAAFDGLYAALTEVNWDKYAPLRLILWISAASAHPKNDPKNPLNYSLEQLIGEAHKRKIRFGCIKIKSDLAEGNERHRYQVMRLALGKTSNDQGFFKEMELDKAMSDMDMTKLVALLEAEIARLYR